MAVTLRRGFFFLLVGLALLFGMNGWNLARGLGEQAAKPPDIFSQQGVVIAPNETAGTVLAVNSDVWVAGTVSGKVVVLNGNLFLSATGRVEGPAVILNGQIHAEEGAYLQAMLSIVLPREEKLTDLTVVALLAMVVFGSPVLALLFVSSTRHVLALPYWRRWQKIRFFLEGKKRGLFLVAGMVVSLLMLLLFFYLAQETLWDNEMVIFDSLAIWLVRYYANPVWDQIMLLFTMAGSAAFFITTAVFLVLLSVLYPRWQAGWALSLCLGGSALLNTLFKQIFARPRPDILPVVSATGYSFPSGHAMIALCFYGMVAYLISRHLPGFVGRIVLFVLTGVFVMLIGISRIYLGVHYPSDVLAGYAAGAMWLAFCISLVTWRKEKQPVDLPR